MIAYVGFLPVVLCWHLAATGSSGIAGRHAIAAVYLGLVLVALSLLPQAGWLLGLTTLLVVLTLRMTVVSWQAWRNGRTVADARPIGEAEIAILAGTVYVVALDGEVGLFGGTVGDGTNWYLHIVGYVMGFFVPYLTFNLTDGILKLRCRLLQTVDIRCRPVADGGGMDGRAAD